MCHGGVEEEGDKATPTMTPFLSSPPRLPSSLRGEYLSYEAADLEMWDSLSLSSLLSLIALLAAE